MLNVSFPFSILFPVLLPVVHLVLILCDEFSYSSKQWHALLFQSGGVWKSYISIYAIYLCLIWLFFESLGCVRSTKMSAAYCSRLLLSVSVSKEDYLLVMIWMLESMRCLKTRDVKEHWDDFTKRIPLHPTRAFASICICLRSLWWHANEICTNIIWKFTGKVNGIKY